MATMATMATTSWEVSNMYRHSDPSSTPQSTTTPFLVTYHQELVILRDPISLTISRTWKLPFPASPKSTNLTTLALSTAPQPLILAYAASVGAAWILHPDQELPVAKIEVGAEGAVGMAWSGKGDTVLVWSAHKLRISLYQIGAPTPALHILHPKLAYPLGFAFKPETAAYLAVAERHAGRDHIGIYDTDSWKLLRHFPLPSTTSDIADLAWSPCGRYIAVWETLTEYLLHIYTPDGRLLTTFSPYASLAHIPNPSGPSRGAPIPAELPTLAEGDKERSRQERSTEGWVGLGIRTVRWHPSGDWIAVGGWDGKIRVLTRAAWAPVAELVHPLKITGPSVHIWREPTDWIEETRGKGIVAFDEQPTPYSPPYIRADLGKPNPRMGISDLSWSSSGHFLASHHQSYPNVIWIYAFSTPHNPHFKPTLHTLLILNSPAKASVWQPLTESGELLTIVSASKSFTTWREPLGSDLAGTAEGVGIPSRTPFAPTTLRYISSGSALVLADRETYAVAYPILDSDTSLSLS